MDINKFENDRWRKLDQPIVNRHMVAAEMIDGGKVLDLGCGDGLFLELLKNKNVDGIGLDVSEFAVAKCRRRGIEAQVFNIVDDKFPYQNCSFDYVVLLDVLEHVYQPEELLAKAVKVYAKYIIISIPNFNSLPSRLQMFFGKVPENSHHHKGHIYWFNYYIIKKMITKSGLAIDEIKINTFWKNKPLLSRLIVLAAKKFPNLFGLSFVIKLKKLKNEK